MIGVLKAREKVIRSRSVSHPLNNSSWRLHSKNLHLTTVYASSSPHPDYERGSDALTDPSHLILRDGLFSTFQVNLSRSSSTEEDAILSHIRSSRGTKPRSWCPSPVGAGQAAVLPRSQSEESSLNRAVLESWRRTPDVSTSPCTNWNASKNKELQMKRKT